MPDSTVFELTPAVTEDLTGDEIIYTDVITGERDRKITLSQIKDYVAPAVDEEYPELGSIYTKSSNFTLADFTVLGSAATLASGDIVLSGGEGPTAITKGLLLNNFEDSDNRVTMIVDFVLNNTSGSISIGKESTNNRDWYWPGIVCKFDLSDGKVKTYNDGNAPGAGSGGTLGTAKATSEDSISVINGSKYRLFFRVDEWLLIVSVSRLDSNNDIVETAWSVSEFSYETQAYINSNTSKFCIYTHGGQQRIKYLDISSQSQIGLPCVDGDSKSVPVGSYSYYDAWHGVLGRILGVKFNNLAGNGDKLEDQVKNLLRVIALKAPFVFFFAGRNNLGYGNFNSTTQNLLIAYDNALAAAGTPVYYFWNMPENAITDQSSIGAFLNSAFPGRVYDMSPGFDKDTMLNSANESPAIHENSFGGIYVGKRAAEDLNLRKFVNRSLYNAKKRNVIASMP